MNKILFEITEEHLDNGLRGFPIGTVMTSRVDPDKGLFYRDLPIKEMAYLPSEEVMYYLIEGKRDKGANFQLFCHELRSRSTLSLEVKHFILGLPKEVHPMKKLIATLAVMADFEKENKYPEDCLGIIAKMPEVIALIINSHEQWEQPPHSRPDLGYIENFCAMLNVPHIKNKELFQKVVQVFFNLHLDHGGGNASTFIGKATASTLEDIYGSLAASMCALDGPKHGRANQECLAFVKEVLHDVGAHVTPEMMKEFIRKRLEEKKLIFGFGHAVLRVEDPRAQVFAELGKKYFADHPLVKIGLILREAAPLVLKENPKIQNPYANVDLLSGSILSAVGFEYPELFTLLFGFARTVGIARQIVYERCEARDGKGVAIYRPKYVYRSLK